jgi:hypothetical protein
MTPSEMDDTIIEWLIRFNDRWVCVAELRDLDWWSMYNCEAIIKMLPTDPEYYKSINTQYYGHFKLSDKAIRRLQNETG